MLIPLTATFPSVSYHHNKLDRFNTRLTQGLFMYWLTSSIFSMGQILMLKVPAIRSTLGIPQIIKHPPPGTEEGKPQKGVMETLKQSKSRQERKKFFLNLM